MPCVATSLKPSVTSPRATSTAPGLSTSRTDKKAVPLVGRRVPEARELFMNARAKSRSMPITSPVERISGPRIVSTPSNFTNGNTTSFTDTCFGSTSPCGNAFCSARDTPAIAFAAIFASGLPMALDTNGIVRDARGLTSRM